MDKTLLITGANGYLGHYAVLEALGRGYGIIAGTHAHFASVRIAHPRVEYVEFDITKAAEDQKQINEIMQARQIDAIINCAALLGSSDPEANERVNAQGVKNVMNLAQNHGIRRFIHLSSVVVLKAVKGPYGEAKLKGQQLLMASDLDYTVFIPALIMGAESLGLNRVLKNIFRFPVFVPLIGSGKETQHPIYVKDLAKAMIDAIENPKTIKKNYQIAGDKVISFRNFAEAILKFHRKQRIFVPVPIVFAKALGVLFQKTQKVPLFTVEHVKGILQDSKLDTHALKNDTGFCPTPFEQALGQTLDAIGNNWNTMLKPRAERVIKINKKENVA